MAPRIVLRPVFWTRSSLLVCVLAAGAHALALYSNVYLTAPVSWFLLVPFHRFVVSMTDVGPVLLLDILVFLLGVVFCLQASE